MFSQITKILCISLKERPYRRVLAQEQFEQAGLASRVEWLLVDQAPDPKAGFSQSQAQALALCREEPHSLILEDDVVFTGNISLATVLEELPEDYLACWLGGNVRTYNRNRVSAHLWLCRDTWTTHAVIYSAAGIEAILSRYKAPEVISDPGQIYDEWLRVNLQPFGGCYICKPFFAVQSEGWSDIENRPTYYGPLWRRAEVRLQA
jgi:hypothetical protein